MKINLTIFFVLLISISASAWADSRVLNVMKNDPSKFTFAKKDGTFSGDKISVMTSEGEAQAVIVECRKRSCLAQLRDDSAVIEKDMVVKFSARKRKYAVALSVDNALGLTYGAAFYYNFPKAPWMVGIKLRQISNETNDIKLSGQILSLEAQRFLKNWSRFQIWGTSEIGLMNFAMDVTKVNPAESDIKEMEYFATLGIEARYNLTTNLRIIGGVGMIYNTLDSTYSGDDSDYDLEVSNFYGMAKLGLAYFF